MHKLILLVTATVLVVGCRSVDVVSQHSNPAPKCEVHGVQMHPEWIDVSSSEAIYKPGYLDEMKRRFPHHGGVLLSGERGFSRPFESRVRDFVCSDCTRVYEEYWKEKGQ